MLGKPATSPSGREENGSELGGQGEKRPWHAPKLLRLDGRGAQNGVGLNSDIVLSTSAS
jgi:hypothetical protein